MAPIPVSDAGFLQPNMAPSLGATISFEEPQALDVVDDIPALENFDISQNLLEDMIMNDFLHASPNMAEAFVDVDEAQQEPPNMIFPACCTEILEGAQAGNSIQGALEPFFSQETANDLFASFINYEC